VDLIEQQCIKVITDVGSCILWEDGDYTTKQVSGWTHAEVETAVLAKIEAGEMNFNIIQR
jgi:hypothetical protein